MFVFPCDDIVFAVSVGAELAWFMYGLAWVDTAKDIFTGIVIL